MAGGEATLIRESTAVPTTARPSPRFLLPRASGNRVLPSLPPLPPHDLVLDGGIHAKFEGWADSTDLWRQWVAKLRPLHEPLWRELAILEGILATTYRVRRESEGALLQLVPFWSPPTNTFVFPWGEATVTLEDIVALAGLPILGFPVREPRYSDKLVEIEMADERELAAVRAVLLMDQREGTGSGWAEHFLRQHQPEEAGGRRGEREQRLEHAAFLSLWLARFVLPAPSDSGSEDIVPGEEVLPIAVRLAHGHSAALAPAVLASIYSDLSALHRHFIHSKRTEAPTVSAPMHILQLWVWERFPELRPATVATASVPADATDGEDVMLLPRAAQWHDVHRALDPGYARAVFTAPKEFEWRPYGSSFWVRRRGHGGARAPLSSFARCLQACELVGVDYIEQYNPHRVARQLGFDQDVPGTMTRLNTNLWERAWETYNTGAEDYAFAIPSDEPGVTDEYAQWWKPYSVACAVAVEERDALASNRELDSLMEETSNKGSGNNEGSSSRNDTSGPKWAVGTMEMIQRASVNRQAEMAGSRELVAKLVKDIQELAIDI
ncbi:uncharacterized protein [Miscanthus floridulus]|uniref:uncharacterized protein n=1 Tax=Miscanthus floridulus TaxID=154761 RepID=UPI003459E12E